MSRWVAFIFCMFLIVAWTLFLVPKCTFLTGVAVFILSIALVIASHWLLFIKEAPLDPPSIPSKPKAKGKMRNAEG